MSIFKTPVFAIIAMLLVSFAAWAEDEEAAPAVAKYVELSPPFVANFGTSSKKLKYVKAEVSLRVPSEEAAALIEANKPLVRHHIVMLLSSQSAKDMAQPNSQELIRQAALAVIKEAMMEETGAEQVDDLLFTSFVVQG